VLLVALTVLSLLGYVGSVGPVAATVTRHNTSAAANRFEMFYAPLCVGARICPAIGSLFSRYSEACDRDGLWMVFNEGTGRMVIVEVRDDMIVVRVP
jgi:hypothetical protein